MLEEAMTAVNVMPVSDSVFDLSISCMRERAGDASDLRRRYGWGFQVWLRYLESNWLEDASLVSHMLQVVKPPHNAPVPPKLC